MPTLVAFIIVALGCGGASADAMATDSGAARDGSTDSGVDAVEEDTGTPSDGDVVDSVRAADTNDAASSHAVRHVFVIMLENRDWADIKGDSSATFINGTLVPSGAHAENYKTPPGNHPSEPNYIWLEAGDNLGDNLGITTDDDPSANHRSTKDHFVSQLENAGHTWKSYQEDIDGKSCPLTAVSLYVPRHNPSMFFEDVTDTNSPTSARCIEHVRPFSELESDLSSGKVAEFNFITPNLCHDMHGNYSFSSPCITSLVRDGDAWLAANVPTRVQIHRHGNLIVRTFVRVCESRAA